MTSNSHGEWLAMIKEKLPFNQRTAQRLIAVSTNDNLRKATHVSHLPASWPGQYSSMATNPFVLSAH
jgi:hypothetical protein